MNWMLSGGGYTGSDIGGFYGGSPDEELYIRWLQFATLSPLMRLHGIGPREPYIFNKRIQKIALKWFELRQKLMSYLLKTASTTAKDGIAMARPMALSYPKECPDGTKIQFQYMLGDDLLCVPIVDPGGTVRFWLPQVSGVITFAVQSYEVTGGLSANVVCRKYRYFLKMAQVVFKNLKQYCHNIQ